jgi:hypothetical protein
MLWWRVMSNVGGGIFSTHTIKVVNLNRPNEYQILADLSSSKVLALLRVPHKNSQETLLFPH